MREQIQITDEAGYHARQQEVDTAILNALALSPITQRQVHRLLFLLGVGDATSEDPLVLSYSSTGAISRAATNSLRWRGLIHNSFHRAVYERPFRFYLGPRP